MRGRWRPVAAVVAGWAVITWGLPPAEADGPVLTAVAPASAVPGDTLTLTGRGLGSAGPGAAVAFVGPDAAQPEVFGTILSWSDNAIRVQVPPADLWPGQAAVQVENPGAWAGPTNRLPVTVTAAGGPVVAPAAAWVPSPGGGTGTLHVGWYDANGAPAAPISLTLPAGMSVADSATATVDGAAAGVQVSGDVLTLLPAAGGARVPGQVTVAVSGVAAGRGTYALTLVAGGVTASVPVTVAPDAVAGYQVSAPDGVRPGVPFPLRVQAVAADGSPVTAGGTVYLSADGRLDFRGADRAAAGPTTAAVTLQGGAAEVTAVAPVAGTVSVTAVDGAGVGGTGSVRVQAAGGVQVAVYPPFSGYAGTPAATFTAGNVDARALHSGARVEAVGSARPIYGGFWPVGVGKGYEAVWTGTLTVTAPPALPAPLPQPVAQYAFLHVALHGGGATLEPVAGTGASINGGTGPVSIPTAGTASGWVPPVVVTLTPGQYRVTVRVAEDAPEGVAGDTLYYSQGFAGTAAWPGTAAPTLWSPLVPVPPAAFGAGGGASGLPDPALTVTIGASTADAGGTPVALPQAAVVQNGRTLLPLRALAELLGARVDWDAAAQRITVTGPAGQALLTVGSATAYVNGSAVTLDQAPLVLPPGVTMVPLRFLGQALGWQVAWDDARGAAVLLPPLSSTVPARP